MRKFVTCLIILFVILASVPQSFAKKTKKADTQNEEIIENNLNLRLSQDDSNKKKKKVKKTKKVKKDKALQTPENINEDIISASSEKPKKAKKEKKLKKEKKAKKIKDENIQETENTLASIPEEKPKKEKKLKNKKTKNKKVKNDETSENLPVKNETQKSQGKVKTYKEDPSRANNKDMMTTIERSRHRTALGIFLNPNLDVQEIRASHILVKKRKDAVKIKKDIENGVITFEDAAKQYSLCPTGVNGGDLGYFNRKRMDQIFTDTAFDLRIGEISNPVGTKFGWHLIKVFDKR